VWCPVEIYNELKARDPHESRTDDERDSTRQNVQDRPRTVSGTDRRSRSRRTVYGPSDVFRISLPPPPRPSHVKKKKKNNPFHDVY